MAGDSNYASVSLHLPFNGPASSATFFDRAPVPKAITNTGGATILADQSKYNGTSLYLDGANDTLSTPSHADFNFGTGDFTIELWVYGTRTNQPHGFPRILANGAYLASGAWNLVLISSSGALGFDTYNGSVANGSAIGTLPENTWSHIAVTRQSGTLRTFLNGTVITTKTDNQSLSGAYVTNIGSDTVSFFKGYIDDLRITKGVARYTANFTPVECQIGGLDSVDQFYSKVSLLLNGDATPLADQSPVVKTITKVGNVDISLLNSKAGLGSLYFDGTGDYLTIPDSSEFDFGTGDFTLECWYYPLSVSGAAGSRGLISQRTNANVDHSFSLFVNQNNAGFGFAFTLDGSTNNEQYFGSALTVNTWYHVAVSRVGANLYFAVNGTVTAAAGSASALFNSSQPVQIGRLGTYTGGDLHGYLDSVRVSKGVARYTANFTPPNYVLSNYIPTAKEDPFFSNVALLLPFDGPNAGTTFLDRSSTPKTVTPNGNAQINTAQSKFNSSSALFDGSGDYLSTLDNSAFKFGAEDFTMELWVRPWADLTAGQYGGLICKRVASNNQAFALLLSGDGTKNTYFFLAGQGGAGSTTDLCSAPFPTPQVWSHIAVVRKGNQMRLFVNGVGGTPVTLSFSSAFDGNYNLVMGRMSTGAGNTGDFTGHMDDLRITKGVARYWDNFTPSTAPNPINGLIPADPNLASVKLLVNADQSPVVDKSPSARSLTFNGTAARDLVRSKFGPASLFFDGSNNGYVSGDTTGLSSTSDFTVECWAYINSMATTRFLFWAGQFSSVVGIKLSVFSSGLYAEYGNISVNLASAGVVNSTWQHFAFTKSGNTYKIFVDGVLVKTITNSSPTAFTIDRVAIGAIIGNGSAQSNFNGYIDDLRFTQGVARYTDNFTPPTAPFEEYTVVAETLTLSIPTSFSTYQTLSLTIPTSFVVVDKFTLSIPTQFVNHETLVLSVPTQFNVNLLLTLQVPTQFSLFELLQVQIPAQFIVGDAVYVGGGDSEINGSELNGSEINGGGRSGSYLVTRLHIPTQIRVGEFVQLQIATQFNVNPLTYQLSIPTYFLVGSYVQLQLPTSFTVVSFPRRLSIPAAFINYEVFDISLPTQFSVSPPSLQLSIPTLFWKHETLTLGLPARFQVSPGFSSGAGGQGVGSVVHLPTTRSQEWSLQVKLGGVDVSSRLTGKISVDLEESSAAVAVFTLRLPDGMIDPYGWVKAQVEISYEDLVNGVSYLLYQGIVDTPAHDAARGLTEFTCTDNLQNIVRKMTHAQVSALLPNAKWSRHVFDETADSWDYLQNLQETYPYALHLDSSGRLVAYNYQSSAIMYEFTDSVIIDGSLSIGLSNGREIVNQVNVSLDSQYEQYRESIAKIRWEGEGVIPLGLGAAVVWLCSANMPVDAIQGAGATFLDDPLFKVQPGNTNRYGVNMLNPGTDLFVEEFQGLASKRFTQPITESKTFSVQNAASIAQIGLAEEDLSVGVDVVYNESLSEAFTRTRVENKWLCSAGVRLEQPRLTATSYAPYDPLLPVTDGKGNYGFITYPLLPIDYEIWDPDAIPNLEGRAYRLEGGVRKDGRPLYGETFYDFDDYVIEGTDAERSLASDVLVAQAIQRVLSTHRQNRVGFTTFMNPSLQRGQTLRVDTSKVKATGVVYQLQHTFDIDQGTALTNVTLALSSSKALGILDGNYDNLIFKLPTKFNVVDGSVNSVLPVDNSTINYNQVMFQHVNENPDDFTYDNQHWGGFFTSYTAVKYQEFVVEWPDLPETNTGNATVIDNGGIINVDVPNDEFYLIN